MLVLLLSLVIWPPTTMAELAAKEAVDYLNNFRKGIARGRFLSLRHNPLSYFPQTDQLFKLTDDPTLSIYATTLATSCKPTIELPSNHSFVIYTAPTNVFYTDIISRALREWYSKAYEVLPLGDTTYDLDIAKDLEGFAQVVYYKSRRVRCSVLEAICKTASGKPLNSFACVFENKPQIGEKLYPVNPSPVLMEGCQTDSCEKVDPLSECDYNSGLCETVNEEELHMVHAPQAPLHKGLVAYA